ncbi:DinB-like domain containing protein [Fimbriimonadaceae bacterium]
MTVIEATKRNTVNTMEMFLRNFSHIPDDKLTWTPAPTAKSPLRIAAHTALYAARFAKMIRDQKLPIPENLEQWLEERNKEEQAITTREEIELIFRAGTEQVLAALDSLTPEDLDSVLDSGQGWTMSMQHLITLPALHATLHTGQIDFLQTCWNDQQVYVG